MVVSEKIDLSENDAYHRFTPADFSGDNWTYMNVNRLSREEAAGQDWNGTVDTVGYYDVPMTSE